MSYQSCKVICNSLAVGAGNSPPVVEEMNGFGSGAYRDDSGTADGEAADDRGSCAVANETGADFVDPAADLGAITGEFVLLGIDLMTRGDGPVATVGVKGCRDTGATLSEPDVFFPLLLIDVDLSPLLRTTAGTGSGAISSIGASRSK